MKWEALVLAVVAGAFSMLLGCQETAVQPVAIPRPDDQTAYRPMPAPKPLPPAGQIPGLQPGYGQPAAGQPAGVGAAPGLPAEDAFIQAYAKHSPRIMVFVNRTIQGDPLPKDGLQTVIQVEEKQSATGAVNAASNNNYSNNGQSTSAGPYGSSASNTNSGRNNASSFSTQGPAEYTHTTAVKKPTDERDIFGATSTDYDMIEASMVRYFDNSGKVRVQDSEAARARLSREQVLRIENGDPAAARLLATELQTDVLVRVTGKATTQSNGGPAVRLIAKAISLSDARNLGTEYVDMPLPMSKQNIDMFSGYLVNNLMGQMAQKWGQAPQYDPIEVRIYKSASVDDSLKIAGWLKVAPSVQSVNVQSATGGSSTSYAVLSVGYAGAPWALYDALKTAVGSSQGLKATDMQNNTIDLEVTGPMTLAPITTTRAVSNTDTDDRRIEQPK